MYRVYTSSLWLLIVLSFCISGCKELVPLWIAREQFEDYTLHDEKDGKPCAFTLRIDSLTSTKDLRLELELTFDVGISREELPLEIHILNQRASVILNKINVLVNLKKDGKWIGIPHENEIDYTLIRTIIPHLVIDPGTYRIHIYADDEIETKIYGVVAITARLFEIEVDD